MTSSVVRLPVLGTESAPPARVSSEPPSAFHRFDGGGAPFVLVVDGSRIYELPEEVARTLDTGAATADALVGLDLPTMDAVDDAAPVGMSVRSLSLAVAQKCNLGCTYCYADGGTFGGKPEDMTAAVARASVDLLMESAGEGERVHLAFLGGEPLANRSVLVETTEYAAEQAARRGVRLGLAVTSNGTLMTEADAEFFERHGFAVTISLDGPQAAHDRQRPFKNGRGSYETVLARVAPLIASQRRMQVSARVTVTPDNLSLQETLDHLIGLGFHSVGFSPMLSSPTGSGEMGGESLDEMLHAMIGCGETFEQHLIAGRRYPFSNMVQAMEQIHRGTHRPYPCGAGAGYFGVAADGVMHPCHRFVRDPGTELGHVEGGVDHARRDSWLHDRHVHRQEPCRSCWARYLCGGGCHHEVLRRGRTACDYIRGWLHYCLEAYARLTRSVPAYFGR